MSIMRKNDEQSQVCGVLFLIQCACSLGERQGMLLTEWAQDAAGMQPLAPQPCCCS